MFTPLPHHFPAQGGSAISGYVLPENEPCPMDDEAIAIREFLRRNRSALWVSLPEPVRPERLN